MFFEEILFSIGEFSNPKEISSLSQTNYSSYESFKSASFWKFYFKIYFPLETPETSDDWKTEFQEKYSLELKWKNEKFRQISLEGHSDTVTSCFIENNTVWTGSSDLKIFHWDIKTGKIMRFFEGYHDNPIIGIEIIDQKYIISCSGSKNYEMNLIYSSIVIRDYVSGFVLFFNEYIGQVMYFCVHKELIICVVLESEVFFVKIFNLKLEEIFRLELDGFFQICSRQSEYLYISFTSGELLTFNCETFEILDRTKASEKITRYIVNNRNILVTASDYEIIIWNPSKSIIPVSTQIRCIFNFGDSFISCGTNKKILVFENVKDEWIQKYELSHHTSLVTHLWMDSQKIISASRDCDMIIWSMETGEFLYKIAAFMNPISLLVVERDLIIGCSLDATSVICDFSQDLKKFYQKVEYTVQTPIDKIKEISETNRNLILVLTGAFSPIHKMHVQLLENVKKFMEEKHNFNVIGGYLSPAHDAYNKFGLLNAFHRVNMCELEIENSNWIMVDKWECTQPSFVMQNEVLQHIKEVVSKKIQDFDIFYCCGSDLLQSQMSIHHLLKFGVICQIRPNYDRNLIKKFENEKNLYFCEEEINFTSSSLIRSLISKKESISEHISERVTEYLKKNKLYYT
jgi:nicotinamide mononucleotide adenylyltransferase